MTTARGPNVSILHLRSTSEPWETSPTSAYPSGGGGGVGGSSRSYSGVRNVGVGVVLTKHQSLGGQPGKKDEGQLYSAGRINSQELFVSGGGMCSRELSPVRWCDQEVDGVYLGRSGWVQVQQRSLDENRRVGYGGSGAATQSLPQSRRPGIKLADYHCNSEPGKCPELNRSLDVHVERPAYLPLKTRDVEEYASASATPSPHSIPESFSPPPITPIISPPPAFQDRVRSKPRPMYGKPPFLPRSDAIVDSDIISPPVSPPPPPPPINWTTLPETRQGSGIANMARKMRLTPSPVSYAPLPGLSGLSGKQHSRIPQAKSLEEAAMTTPANRRSQFVQRYKDSSSSSSSSLGFRSLDSCVSRPMMPRLAEHGSSIDIYEDADEEDNNSSSLNLSNVSSTILNSSPDSVVERVGIGSAVVGVREKTSPSGRSSLGRTLHHRSQSHQRRSPASSDNKQATCSSPSSSSSSSGGFPARSPSGSAAAFRRSAPNRQKPPPPPQLQDDQQRVRRSRSLQLPEKRSPGSCSGPGIGSYRVSPQQTGSEPHRVVVRMTDSMERAGGRRPGPVIDPDEHLDQDVLREAEVVTEFLYGSRSRAAAKALLLHRYHDRREEAPKEPPKFPTNNGYNVYFVGHQTQQRHKTLQRGATAPNLQPTGHGFTPSPTSESKNPCNSATCDFWPHCAQRETLNHQAQNVYSMKVSPSYHPQHQHQHQHQNQHQRSPQQDSRRDTPEPPKPKRSSGPMREKSDASDQYVRELSVSRRAQPSDASERKTSPINPKAIIPPHSSARSPTALGGGNSSCSCSSSSSDVWITTSDRTMTKSQSPRNAKSSGASTPLDDNGPGPSSSTDRQLREMILTRPGSAPVNVQEEAARLAPDSQQKRSMSLPKSFLSGKNKHGGEERATIVSPVVRRVNILGLGGSVGTPPDGLTAPLLLARDFEELERKKRQVFGKIVFFNPAFTSYKDVRRIRYEGAYRAAVHGAVAVVIRSNTPYVSEHAHAGLLVYPNGTHRIPAAAVSTHDADRLGALLRGGTDVVFRLEMASHRAGMAQTENLVAEIRGRAETEADLVVLAAHVDSWDVGQGVLDDGTGIFLSWNALAILKILDLRPRRTLRGQFPCKRQGSESIHGLSPSPRHRPPTPEVAHTAPVTPLHDPVSERRRSPGHTKATRRAKASSTPHLLDQPEWENNRKWNDKSPELASQKEMGPTVLLSNPRLQADLPKDPVFHSQRNISSGTAESVLQKFRKTFSLRFQKKGSKESGSADYGDCYGVPPGDPSEDDALHHHHPQTQLHETLKEPETTEQKHRFGPLVWRSSKERKKSSKASRSAKCNSGDSGIQIEMVSGFSGSGLAGDSSESHDTDQQGDGDGDGDGDETDSPPAVRRRSNLTGKASRPHSDLINQILIDKFKADLQSRAHRHQYVRRTHSDLGGQRIFQWEARSSYRRMMSTPSPLKSRPQQRLSPRRKPPDAPGGVQLRPGQPRRNRPTLRRSLSQPIDMDKLSPLMRTKTAGLRAGNNVVSEDEHDGRLGTSDDEMMSDSESSIASLSERKKSLELTVDEEMVILAEAVFDHVAIEAEELAFRAGDVIEVLETVNRDWWWGSTGGRTGWFPAAFVRLRVSQEDTVEDCLAAMASGKATSKTLRRRTSISLLSNEQVRTSVVRELVHTERDFVKVLTDVVEGYIAECRRRKDMFSPEQIQTIFINLEDMLKFQSQFLKDLEQCIDWDAPHNSCVGDCFLKHRSGFRMYSDYCNHHPMATATLQELYQFNSYSKFFEACRLMRGLIEIPLDGYLLTPVQRICKYPLQLAELLKYTKADHPDYDKIKEALEAMRDVAVLINERKRRMESLEKLAAWQQRVEGWEGEDLIQLSSQLIHQGEVVRVTSGMWTNNITLFLFDHQIIYCKKDILKRNTYVYKGRICLDTSEVLDIPDGKDPQLGVNVRHGLKVYSCVRDKWLLFCCRSVHDKQKWLNAFTQERRSVTQDRDDGLELPPSARKLARLAARCQRRPPSKPRGSKNYKHDSAYMGSSLQINAHGSNSLGRKMGTWFMFGSNKKTRHYDQSS